MDALDTKLTTQLRHNGRQSISDLATQLGVSRATVRARMERLENSGVILGYTVILKSDATELPVRGIMMIEIEGYSTDRVVRSLSGFPEISAIHTTNGRWDLVVELGTGTLSDFDAVLRRIRLIQGVINSETNLLLATPRSTKARL
ncbi:AsnC family transcriptional regulator [Acidocella aquatica]|uniref:AsnC family transcriptional regulator n=1 Tax=Acidocella aquatica TaxID=1922313 RepID=A0ABQ6A8S1_9PROT|nr:Lrp/AsnC family transcriptional regulator [Acidocella aquatica]GLR67276.1 AsnC family transcriptional regulator [Acidocella aquatica]